MPSLFPPLDSFFPLQLINIISQLPFKLQSPTPTSTPFPPIVVSKSENQLELHFGNIATVTVQQFNYYGQSLAQSVTQFKLNFYDNTPANSNSEDSFDKQYYKNSYWH